MSTYVIGDIQGCHEALEALLAALEFDRTRDRVWITGDLVNRGENSLAVLRWCMHHDDCVVAVLGNHDLHLLAVAEGFVPPHRKDTLDMILQAPDRAALLEWLRHRPMLHREGSWLMLHAGLPPEWDADAAQSHAGELERALRGPHWRAFLKGMYGNEPRRWNPLLAGQDRLRKAPFAVAGQQSHGAPGARVGLPGHNALARPVSRSVVDDDDLHLPQRGGCFENVPHQRVDVFRLVQSRNDDGYPAIGRWGRRSRTVHPGGIRCHSPSPSLIQTEYERKLIGSY